MNFLQELRELLPKIEYGSVDELMYEALLLTRKAGKLMFIGNGGSAAIASHMAIDWTKNGGVPAMCFNDSAAITAVGNDIGFHAIFSLPLSFYGSKRDVLFAISSSGESQD